MRPNFSETWSSRFGQRHRLRDFIHRTIYDLAGASSIIELEDGGESGEKEG